MAQEGATRAHWSGRLAFVLAASGSAVGLGNIWKFPYMAGVNGGGAFVLLYLVCIAAVGLPVLIAEIYIGKKGQKNAVEAFDETLGQSTPWRNVGLLGVISAFLILSFYSVVGGWVLDFEVRALTNAFHSEADKDVIAGAWGESLKNAGMTIFWHTLFMALTIGIVLGGIQRGIERWSRILMPTLFVILIGLFFYATTLDGFGEAMAFLFLPDFSKLTGAGFLEAVGHSFFTLSLGMGAMITYGSYLSEHEPVIGTAITVAILDTVIALTAGSVIFAVVYSFGADPSGGPGLMFSTLPVLFSQTDYAWIISVVFFMLVGFAALTSAISMLEVVVAYFDEVLGWSRTKSTLTLGAVIWALGLLCALSFNVLSDFTILDKTFFDLFDVATSQYLLPIGGLLIAVFYGWTLGEKHVQQTFESGASALLVTGLMWSARVIAPMAILALFVKGIFF